MATLSREVEALIRYLDDSGVPHVITATLGTYRSPANPCAPHTPKSNHCGDGTDGKGLAIDCAGPTPGTNAQATLQMTAIHNAFKPVAPQLAELFYNGPGITSVVKDGVWRNGLQTLGAETWAAHRNHVHVAVPKGMFLRWSDVRLAQVQPLVRPPVTLEVKPMWDPPLQVVDFLPYWAGGGGYMLFADGGVGHVGDAPPHLDEAGKPKQPFGNDYWINRTPARIERLGDIGYVVIATSGERYEYP